ncbi:MAG: hypothetical protein ACFFD7_15630 [Candidatus Thorarchaeota archaeon]
MSKSEVNKEFSEFGGRMKAIAILTLISIIAGIFSGAFSFAGFIEAVLGLVIFILFILVLGDIKSAGVMLNNKNLLSFRSKVIISFILGIIGMILFTAGLVGLGITIFFVGIFILSIIPLTISIIGIIILLFAAILQIQAWSRLESFFANNATLFPQEIAEDARVGAKFCKIGAILDITIILMFIGDILRVIGYFKLAPLEDLDQISV